MRERHTTILSDSPWIAFQYPIFKMLWIASVVSSIGTWMQDVGAAWLMVTLTTHPLMVVSIQAITSFSIFLFALPAGAIADVIDRRLYLILSQTGLMIAAAILALITFFGKATPEILLFLTFCLGSGAALSFPAWFTLMSELVPNKHMTSAVALVSVSINFSRAVGPALAGFIIAATGPAAVFALNSISFFGIILVLYKWEKPAKENTLPAERIYGAIRAGLRYAKGSPALQTLLIKSGTFFIFASGLWALLPLVARIQLHCEAIGYGILLALFGCGAILGAFFLPKLRQNLNCDQLIFSGAIGFGLSTFVIAFSSNFYVDCGVILLGGMAWICVLTTFTTLVQQVVSPWVRARALSIFLSIFFGGISIGSMLWGWIATHYSLSVALSTAAIGLIGGNILTYRFVSGKNLLLNQGPSEPVPLPVAVEQPRHEEGPVMVTIEYRVERKNVDMFTHAMRDLGRIRLRDGAFFWSLFKDIENPHKFVECYMIESWLEHLRQHERLSISDREIQNKAFSFHQGKTSPLITHFIAHKIPKKQNKKTIL